MTVGGDVTSATVPDLTPNEEWEFRVIATNAGGDSDPSNPSKPVITKPRNLAPKIAPIKPITIKAGQMISLEAVVEDKFLSNFLLIMFYFYENPSQKLLGSSHPDQKFAVTLKSKLNKKTITENYKFEAQIVRIQELILLKPLT